jgi:hypothetical protein
MKKTVAYAATAILLGFAVMLLPLPLVQLQPQALQPAQLTEDSRAKQTYGLASQPLNLLPSSLIFLTGLIAALGVYAMTKRRRI